MFFDNKSMVILGLIGIACGALYCGDKDLSLAIASGLVGFLSKDASDYIKHADEENEEKRE